MLTYSHERYVSELAERAVAITMMVTENNYKLGGQGLIAHYCEVADLAVQSFTMYPVDFDWEAHMDGGGDCWDIEIVAWALARLEERYNGEIPQWEFDTNVRPRVQSDTSTTARPINVTVPTAALDIGRWKDEVKDGQTLMGYWEWQEKQEGR